MVEKPEAGGPPGRKGKTGQMTDTIGEQISGGTAPGAVRSVAYYLTGDGAPSPKETAQRIEIHEYDSAGNLVHITYGEIAAAAETIRRSR
jgi:hypothetical protein